MGQVRHREEDVYADGVDLLITTCKGEGWFLRERVWLFNAPWILCMKFWNKRVREIPYQDNVLFLLL